MTRSRTTVLIWTLVALLNGGAIALLARLGTAALVSDDLGAWCASVGCYLIVTASAVWAGLNLLELAITAATAWYRRLPEKKA